MVTREAPWPEGTPAWVELITPAHEDAEKFYSEVLGWQIVPGPAAYGRYGFALVHGRPAAGIGAASTGAASWTTYLAVQNVRRTCGEVLEYGGVVLTSPAPVGDQGWAALVADPTGGIVGLWQAADHMGTQIVDEPGAPCWAELLTSQPESARTFFSSLFGHRHQPSPSPTPGDPDYTMTAPREAHARAIAGIGLLPDRRPDAEWAGELPFWMTFFAVADVDAALDRVRSGGGSVHAGPRRSPYGRVAVCADPQGAVFTVIRLPRRR